MHRQPRFHVRTRPPQSNLLPYTRTPGMLPLARELLRQGTTVIVAANEAPSINDITAAELDALLPQARQG